MAESRAEVELDQRYVVVCTGLPDTGPILMNARGTVLVNDKTLGTWERVVRGDYMVAVPNVSQMWGDTPQQAAMNMVIKLYRAGRLHALVS